ncbi:hypothetical protein Tco_1225842 [Tanacetum coccineum]
MTPDLIPLRPQFGGATIGNRDQGYREPCIKVFAGFITIFKATNSIQRGFYTGTYICGINNIPWHTTIWVRQAVMSADFRGTIIRLIHSEARSWSIPSEDPYEEAAQQLFEQAPRHPEYVPENHIPVYIPEPEHPEDLVPV